MTIEHVKKVKERYESDLLSIEGIQGVGIGEDGGKPAIKVYVDKAVESRTRRIPRTLDDVPVLVEESGLFEAH